MTTTLKPMLVMIRFLDFADQYITITIYNLRISDSGKMWSMTFCDILKPKSNNKVKKIKRQALLKSVAGQILKTTQSCFEFRLFSAEIFSQACMEIVLTVFLSCYSLLCFIFCRFLFIFITLPSTRATLFSLL